MNSATHNSSTLAVDRIRKLLGQIEQQLELVSPEMLDTVWLRIDHLGTKLKGQSSHCAICGGPCKAHADAMP